MKLNGSTLWVLLGAALLWGAAANARADFITGYAWRTGTGNNDLAAPATLNSSTCHLKSDGITTEPCTHTNYDLRFTTEGIGFKTPAGESAPLQTFGQFLSNNANTSQSFPINNKSYQNNVNDATLLDTVIFEFVGFGTFTGTVSSPQSFTFAHDDGLTFTVNGQVVVNKPDRTSPITTLGAYTGGAGNNLPFQLVYTECCTPPAVLETDLVGPTADRNPLTLTSLNPASTVAGGPGFALTANGTGFLSDSILMWNSSPRTTTLVNGTLLTALISAADIAAAGTASVNVVNPAEGAASNALTFTIKAPGNGNPPPFVVSGPTAAPNPTYTKTTALSAMGGTLTPGAVLSYTWMLTGTNPSPNVTFTNQGSAAGTSSVATFPNEGAYHIFVRILDSVTKFAVDSTAVDVIVIRNPTDLNLLPSNPPPVQLGQSLNLTATPVDQWSQPMTLAPTWTTSLNAGAGAFITSGQAASLSVNDTSVNNVTVTASVVDKLGRPISKSTHVTIVVAGAGGGDISNAKAYPVPFKSNSGDPGITFTGLAPGTRIRIFTLRGRLVQTLDSLDGKDVLWDIKNANLNRVSSGVYFYIIEAAGQKKEGKLVVIQ